MKPKRTIVGQPTVPGNLIVQKFPVIRNMESWRQGTITADLTPLEKLARAGDLRAQARLQMLKGIQARRTRDAD